MNKVAIKLNGEQLQLDAGLTKVDTLYKASKTDPEKHRLYLDKSGDIDIPLLPNDHIVIRGEETITVGDIDADIGDNPKVRKPIQIIFNDQKEGGFKQAKVNSDDIYKLDKELKSPKLFLDIAGQEDIFIAKNLTLIIQENDFYFTIPASDDDSIDLEDCSKGGHHPPKGQKAYKIKVDKEKYRVEQQEITGKEILQLVGKDIDQWTLNQKLRGGRRVTIEPDAIVDLAEPGIERFETVMKQAQQG